MLVDKYRPQIDAIFAKYPADRRRSAVMPLLCLAQQEYGAISRDVLSEVATLIGITPTEVASVAGFYSLYTEHREAKRRVQICTDLPCALRGADQFAEELCASLRIKLGETTADGEFMVEAVACLAGCDKAPMFQVQDETGVHYCEGTPEQPLTAPRALEILAVFKARTS